MTNVSYYFQSRYMAQRCQKYIPDRSYHTEKHLAFVTWQFGLITGPNVKDRDHIDLFAT